MVRQLDRDALTDDAEIVEVEVVAIGAKGDGIARAEDGRKIFIGLAAPGDRLRLRLGALRRDGVGGEILARLADGPDRARPQCVHFGTCGGCQVQHLRHSAYLAWKRGLVIEAFAHQGLSPAVGPLIEIGAATRRRAKFVAERRDAAIAAGFNARHSRRVVDVEACPVLAPALAARWPALRSALPEIIADGGRIELQMLALGAGAELLLLGGGKLRDEVRGRLRSLAAEADLVRIAWRASDDAETKIVHESASLVADFGGVVVELPPGAFLQASAEAEEAMRSLVDKAVGRAKRVADLFAGCGSLAAPLARRAAVHAVEFDEAACIALERAARLRPDLRLSVERRDLERRPLLPPELVDFDAVVFDPPRGGAAAQAKQLARTAVATVIAVSCNPATLARDARVLVDGGYTLESITPIDQFVWSAHVEAVAVFRKPRGRI